MIENNIIEILVLSLATMVPIVLTAIGEIITERAGIVNIGLEGIMLISAWAAALVYIETGSGIVGAYLAGLTAGALLGLLHAVISIRLKGDQIVTGIGVNIFAFGATVIATWIVWGNFSNSPPIDLPQWPSFMGVRISPMIPLTIITGIAAWYILSRTMIGLKIKSAGDDPAAAEALGIKVERIQALATIVGASLAGLAGAYLSVDFTGSFSKGMTAGRGFIALANVAFSGWNPLFAIAGGYIFGFADALSLYLSIVYESGEAGLVYLFKTIPYIVTLLSVALVARRGKMPRHLGRPYIKE